MSWGGLACLSAGILGFFPLLRVHRLFVFLVSITAVQTITLAFFGLKLMHKDLGGAVLKVNRQAVELAEVVSSELGQHKIAWSGEWKDLGPFADYGSLPETQTSRLTRMRLDLARAQARIAGQRNGFPESFVAPLLGIPRVQPVALPPEEQSALAEMESEIPEVKLFVGGLKYIAWGGIAFGLLLMVTGTLGGLRRVRIKRCIENIPSSRASGVAFGLAEVSGRIEAPAQYPPEAGPLTGRPCVYFEYFHSKKCDNDKGWEILEERTLIQRFQCRDESGAITVSPQGAEFITFDMETGGDDDSCEREVRIENDDPVYVLGHAGVDPFTGNSLMLTEPPDKEVPFIVSNCSEFEVLMEKAMEGLAMLFYAVNGLMLAVHIALGMMGAFSATDYLLAALAGPFFLGIVMTILHYNDLVFLRRRVDRNWSNIDVALQKRHDLFPTIEKVVSTYLAHEQELQADLAEMRSQFDQNPTAGPEQAAAFFQSEILFTTRFLGLRENNPDLKGNTLVTQMTKTLVEVENEISLMREGFNDSVKTYNTRIQSIPDVLLAMPFGFRSCSYLQFESTIIDVPDIQLGAAAVAPVASPTGVTNKTFDTGPTMLSPAPAQAEPGPDRASAIQAPAAFPDELLSASQIPETAYAILVALIFAEAHFTAEDLPKLEAKVGDETLVAEVRKYQTQVGTLDDRVKLSLVDHCLPALRLLPAQVNLFERVKELVEWDASISLFEYTLLQIFEREHQKRIGDDSPPPLQWYSFASLDPDVSQIVSFLANLANNTADGDKIFNHCKSLDGQFLQLDRLRLEQNTFDKVDQAINKLAHLDRINRGKLVNTITEALAGIEPTANQIDFLRAVGERLRAL